MSIHTIQSVEALRAHLDKETVTDWVEVTQAMIDQFADATNDHNWIHVDVERAKRESPFGATIAHGFLSLSLLPAMMYEAFDMRALGTGVNYGINRLRFAGPVPAGARVRARFKLSAVEEIPPKGGQGPGVQMTWQVSMEREGTGRPVMIAEWLGRRYAS